MEFTDRILKCVDCGAEFVFTVGEQIFFHDKEFKNDPKHCKQCKAKRATGGSRVRPETRTICSQEKTPAQPLPEPDAQPAQDSELVPD
jgi:DNA-directed RNA polymerase subunit RPC12/RpoP